MNDDVEIADVSATNSLVRLAKICDVSSIKLVGRSLFSLEASRILNSTTDRGGLINPKLSEVLSNTREPRIHRVRRATPVVPARMVHRLHFTVSIPGTHREHRRESSAREMETIDKE